MIITTVIADSNNRIYWKAAATAIEHAIDKKLTVM